MSFRCCAAAFWLPLITAGCLLFPGLAHAQTADATLPPTEAKALFAWLKAGSYKSWFHESKSHPSAGPHPVEVLTYLNPVLDQSLKANKKNHPPRSAAVKELFQADGSLRGWAVSVKTQAESSFGKGWYWYEVTSPSETAKPVAAGMGVPLCFGCHITGKDYVLIPYPLR